MKRLKNITILLCFLSLLAFISCSAEDKTGVANNPPEDTEITDGETGSGSGSGSETGGSGTGGSGTGGDSGSGSSSGGSGTGLPNGYYKGNLTCKTCIIDDDFHADKSSYGANYKEELEQEMKNDDLLYLKIANNKLKWSSYEDALEASGLEESGALKSGSEYSATNLLESNTTESISKHEYTIKFTISGDTISITYIVKASQENKDGTLKFSVDATYEGTLTKYTPTTSSSS